MPHILMIATGGTIACCETAHGLSPALDSAIHLFLQRVQHSGSGCLNFTAKNVIIDK